MRPLPSTVEQELARIAAEQHGLVTRSQLLAVEISASGIKRRLRKGALLRVHRGVYRVGHRAPSTEASYLAAVTRAAKGRCSGGEPRHISSG